ncbi:MAG: agmatinase [Flavobacteriales bacterium]|nr:agmatinase [Flavobacteriales bacterium]
MEAKQSLSADFNFLGIKEEELSSYRTSSVVIQSAPYEHTSSYLAGSDKGPEAILEASHYVEFYDEELDQETYKKMGISTLPFMEFNGKVDSDAVELIETETAHHIRNKKFVVSLGAEHTVTFGFFKAFYKEDPNIGILQIDAHSDLRMSYQGNPYSHASVMARIHELMVPIAQVGIRAQAIEEAELIKSSGNIHTWYAHQIAGNNNWHEEVLNSLPERIYLTIDADGFDPSLMPAVGTAEPGGLLWHDTLTFLKKVCTQREVVGFDVVECAPKKGEILTEFNLARLIYKILGYCSLNSTFAAKYCLE